MSEKQIDYNVSYQQNFYCHIKINDTPLIPGNIISLVVREWALELVPRIHLVFQDDGLFSEITTLQDLDVINVEIGRTPEDKDCFTGSFNVLDWKCNLFADNRLHIIEVTGLLDSLKLYAPVKTRSFRNKTSVNVIKSIANECGLKPKERNGFNPNVDTMTWLQIQQNNHDFVKHILQRSFRNNDVILAYGDSKKNFNITSLNTELSKKDEISAKFNPPKFSQNVLLSEDQNVLWYASYDYVNTNGYLNKITNYGLKTNYYDLSNNKEITVKDNSHEYSELSFKHKDFVGEIVDQNFNGIQTENVHKNFNKAITQNKYYISNFFGYSLVLNVHASVKVSLMDTVMLSVPSLPYIDPNSLNELLTGRYLVGGIIYIIGKNQGFQKHISLHRNGFNKSMYQKSYTSL